MKANKKGFVAVIIVAAVLVGFLVWKTSSNNKVDINKSKVANKKTLVMTAVIAHEESTSDGINANGTLLSNEEVELVAETAGKVVSIHFKEGSYVKKSELLLKVDDADLQAQLTRAELQKKLMGEKLERQRILLNRESVSREAFDQLQTDYNVLNADIELLKVKINRTEIRAPFNGIMGFRYVSEGSYVQTSTKITSIVDYSTLKFEAAIPEKYAGKKLEGKVITFRTDGSDTEYKATIYAVSPSVDVNTRNILIRAKFNNTGNMLKPGMFAKGLVSVDEGRKYIKIPTEAVVPEMEGKRLWVIKNGKAKSILVTTESRSNTDVEIISGISVGDTVLTGGLMQLKEGMKVTPKITL